MHLFLYENLGTTNSWRKIISNEIIKVGSVTSSKAWQAQQVNRYQVGASSCCPVCNQNVSVPLIYKKLPVEEH